MSSIKYILFAGLLSIMAGCGFTPLYQSHEKSTEALSVKVELIPDRDGQILRNHLMDFFNPYGSPSLPAYRLKVKPVISREEFGFRRDATSKRTRINLVAEFSLIDTATETPIYSDRVDVSAGFSVGSKSETASLPQVISEEDARKRVLEQAAREIRLLVASYLHNKSHTER